MNAFAAALEVIYSDPHLSAPASLRMRTGGPRVPNLRVILSAPDEPGAPASAKLLVSRLGPYGPPQRNDLLDIEDGRAFEVQDVELDALGLEWTMRLSTARAQP